MTLHTTDERAELHVQQDENEFFETLLTHIEDPERPVIPVVGPDLLVVSFRGQTMPLYQAVASQFLEYYGRSGVALRPGRELHDAVSEVLRDERDPYAYAFRALRAVLNDNTADVLEPLRDLASVTAFSLFVTTSIDDLLVRAIDEVRHEGAAKTRSIVHAPNLPTDDSRDITDFDLASAQCTAVLHLFGRARSAPLYALHDEDTLEYVHNLQTRGSNVPKRFVGLVRTCDLLFIGCNLPNWLSRFFLRLSTEERLGDEKRPKREFLVGDLVEDADGLIVFLERFSRHTDLFRHDPRLFVKKLAQHWRKLHPETNTVPAVRASRTKDTVFLSYAREDFAAAQQLRQELKAIGVDAVWFDHTALQAGNDWSGEIENAIKRCYLFVALISAQTEQRDEGYFREEWQQAAERSRKIGGRAFIVPIVIDAGYDGNADAYQRVPDAFPRLHFGHAPEGRLTHDLRESLISLVREYRSPKVA